ncbi:rod shape-determining protein RodA, partial [Patescibacteria group bacterium]|nr:rod shape-determining protein RodA [Patescibacteria group bacterium]
MNNLFFRFFKNFDFVLLGATLLLVSLGLVTLFSATSEYGWGSIAIKQSVNVGFGLVGLFALSRLDYRLLKSYTGILYLIVIGMLGAVKIFGLTVKGAERWIDLGFFQLQPSTLSLLLMVIILAKYFADNYEEMNNFKTIARSAIYTAIPAFMIAWQPDLGSAALLVFIWGVMLLISNAKRIYIVVLGSLTLLGMPLLWLVMRDYQKERVLTFLNPAADPMGAGWNVNQAMIAIGSGQFWGRGLGHGTQSQLNYIPEKQTDFIFAMIAEEMGFVGVCILLALFVIVIYRGARITLLARDFFGTYLAV